MNHNEKNQTNYLITSLSDTVNKISSHQDWESMPAKIEMNRLNEGLKLMNKEGFFDITSLNEEAWNLYQEIRVLLVNYYDLAGGIEGCRWEKRQVN